MGKSLRIQDPAGCAQGDRVSVVVFDHLRVGISTSAVIHCVQMRNKAYGLLELIAGCRRQESIGISMLVDKNICHSQRFHLCRK